MEIYQVKSGDTLSKIARDVFGDIDQWPKIAQLNNLKAPYTILPGMQLMLPDIDVLGPVVVQAKRKPLPPTEPASTADAGVPGLGFDLTQEQQQWLYLGAGAVLLFILLGRK